MNKHQLLESWMPTIEQTVGTGLETSKAQLVATIAQIQENYESKLGEGALNENNAFSTLGSVNGMGVVSLPSSTGQGWGTGAGSASNGSGDVPYSLLPLAIQVAAQTIGLELVPTIPMNAPVGMLSYMDFVYAGGKNGYAPVNSLYTAGTSGITPNSPIYVKTALDSFVALSKGATGVLGVSAGDEVEATYLGQSRIDGYAIFKLPRELGGTKTVATVIPTSGTGAEFTPQGGTAKGVTTKAELVKALEDHVVDFTSNQGASNFNEVKKMSRLEGETTPANVGNIQLFSKAVEAETIQAAAAVTREQLMDLKQFGIDAVAQANQFLANEMTQEINKDILGNIFRLGLKNHKNIEAYSGKNYHLVLSSSAGTTDYATLSASNPTWAYFGGDNLEGVSMNTAAVVKTVDAVNTGAENLATRQRRLYSRLLAGTNIISVRGRRGPATFGVVSGGTVTGLQDSAAFVAYPLSNTINQVPGALYPVGTIAGVAIYVDPNMAWEDSRIALGRKGDGNTPGLVFMPYVMADTVETIAEGNMSPKLQMKSRYQIVEAGHHPETMYLTFGAENLVDGGWA